MKDNFKYDLGLVNGKVYQNGDFVELDVYVKDQVIKEIVPRGKELPSENIVRCTNKLIMPGFIPSGAIAIFPIVPEQLTIKSPGFNSNASISWNFSSVTKYVPIEKSF